MKAKIVKYLLVSIPLLAVIGVGAAAYVWKMSLIRGPEKKAPEDESVYGISAGLTPKTLSELQSRIMRLQQQPREDVRWFMNIPKDEVPVIGPPKETRWATPQQLWDKDMVGLYFVGAKDKNTPLEKKKKEQDDRLLQQLFKDL